jgi:hypothetical protein
MAMTIKGFEDFELIGQVPGTDQHQVNSVVSDKLTKSIPMIDEKAKLENNLSKKRKRESSSPSSLSSSPSSSDSDSKSHKRKKKHSKSKKEHHHKNKNKRVKKESSNEEDDKILIKILSEKIHNYLNGRKEQDDDDLNSDSD